MAGEGVSFRSFVSETEIDEKRRKRQEEWDKVRTEDQPLECPEEENYSRSLYEKLQDQKEKKQSDFEEQFKFKNMVRGIDEDESKFLDEVADRQMEIDTRRMREEKEMLEEMKEYADRVIPVNEPKDKMTSRPTHTEKTATARPGSTTRKTQAALLAGVVKRKRSDSDDRNGEKKTKSASSPSSSSQNGPDCPPDPPSEVQSQATTSTPAALSSTAERPLLNDGDKAQVVSILPGLGFYSNSSDSDSSSSDTDVDLLNSVVHRQSKKKSHASCN